MGKPLTRSEKRAFAISLADDFSKIVFGFAIAGALTAAFMVSGLKGSEATDAQWAAQREDRAIAFGSMFASTVFGLGGIYLRQAKRKLEDGSLDP
jgi:hypothetical protein